MTMLLTFATVLAWAGVAVFLPLAIYKRGLIPQDLFTFRPVDPHDFDLSRASSFCFRHSAR